MKPGYKDQYKLELTGRSAKIQERVAMDMLVPLFLRCCASVFSTSLLAAEVDASPTGRSVDKSEIENYVSVYGLRNHEVFNDKPITEIVYVHSKCMIVDDKLTIIGSANVNDRSMLGDRDSEVAILVQDNDLVEGRMNGEPYQVGKYSHSLRCQLFKEHLGLLDENTLCKDIDVQDPVCDELYQTWVKSAKKNLDIFEEVFGGKSLPTDKVLTYQQLKTYEHKIGIDDVHRAKQLLAEMQGRIVPMPLHFLEEEKLLPSFGTKEAFAPTRLVT